MLHMLRCFTRVEADLTLATHTHTQTTPYTSFERFCKPNPLELLLDLKKTGYQCNNATGLEVAIQEHKRMCTFMDNRQDLP